MLRKKQIVSILLIETIIIFISLYFISDYNIIQYKKTEIELFHTKYFYYFLKFSLIIFAFKISFILYHFIKNYKLIKNRNTVIITLIVYAICINVSFLFYLIFFNNTNYLLSLFIGTVGLFYFFFVSDNIETIIVNKRLKKDEKINNKRNNNKINSLNLELKKLNKKLKKKKLLTNKVKMILNDIKNILKLMKKCEIELYTTEYFKLNKLLTFDIYLRFKTFYSLPKNLQKERKEEFEKDIKKIEDYISKVLNNLEKKCINKDKISSNLIQIRY